MCPLPQRLRLDDERPPTKLLLPIARNTLLWLKLVAIDVGRALAFALAVDEWPATPDDVDVVARGRLSAGLEKAIQLSDRTLVMQAYNS